MSISAALAEPEQQQIPDRRAYERVPVAVFGRCMFENRLEIPCQGINISPGDLAAVTAHSPEMNEHVIFYLDNIGRVEGKVARLFEGGFAIAIEGSERHREKLAARIAWCKEQATYGTADMRRAERMVPSQPLSEIRMPDGRAYPVEIIDISLSGAAIKSDIRPALGAEVSLGGMPGHVARHFDNGLAIEFNTERDGRALQQRHL